MSLEGRKSAPVLTLYHLHAAKQDYDFVGTLLLGIQRSGAPRQ